MNIIGIFGFLTIAVIFSFELTITEAGRLGDRCSYNAECRLELACRNNRCTHPCEESFDEHATCVLRRNIWLSQCLPGYQFNPASQKCLPEQSFVPGRKGDRCSNDTQCVDVMVCTEGKCTHPCYKFSDQHAYCTLRNNTWVSICLPGYYYEDESNKCESAYWPEDDPSRHSCTDSRDCGASFLCSKEHRCVHSCELISMEHSICILSENGVFTSECPLGYHYGSYPEKCEPDCKADTECPSSLMCTDGRCVDPCREWPANPYTNCKVENHKPIRTCRAGFVRPSGFRKCVSPTSLN